MNNEHDANEEMARLYRNGWRVGKHALAPLPARQSFQRADRARHCSLLVVVCAMAVLIPAVLAP